MSKIGTPAVVNGIIVDEFLIDNWPDEFSGCWMAILKTNEMSKAYLVKNYDNSEGSVINVTKEPPEFIATIDWTNNYVLNSQYTSEEYRNSGIGYIMGVWARTWVAVNESKKIEAPEGKDRTDIVKGFLARFKQVYNDDSIIL